MTEQEKYNLLKNTLKENGWHIDEGYVENDDRTERDNLFDASKNGVYIYAIEKWGCKDIDFHIDIKDKTLLSRPIKDLEIYSDHINCMYVYLAVTVRLSDAYVLIEYKPEKPEEIEE